MKILMQDVSTIEDGLAGEIKREPRESRFFRSTEQNSVRTLYGYTLPTFRSGESQLGTLRTSGSFVELTSDHSLGLTLDGYIRCGSSDEVSLTLCSS